MRIERHLYSLFWFCLCVISCNVVFEFFVYFPIFVLPVLWFWLHVCLFSTHSSLFHQQKGFSLCIQYYRSDVDTQMLH